MSDETLEMLKRLTDYDSEEQLQEAFDAADNAGYVDDEWSNSPSELVAYINGFIEGSHNK